MISFKNYFLFTESKQEMYGWMAPNGRIYQNGPAEIHGTSAGRLVDQFNIPKKGFHIYERMYYAGWMRINYESNFIYVTNTVSLPNPTQMKYLKQFANKFNMKEIIFDNDETYRVIWSSEDVL